jgi:hypothetical protein
MRIILLAMLLDAAWNQGPFGTWRMNPGRSTFTGRPQPKSFALRIEPHASGEVFTLEETRADGRATTSSTILYFDGRPRDFQDSVCLGSQSSRRLDEAAVEILRRCNAGGWTIRFVRRVSARAPELVLEITEQQDGGRRFEHRLVLERQKSKQGRREP